MTILIFRTSLLTVATSNWTATAITDAKTELVEIHLPQRIDCCRLPMSMPEFLALIADGGKVVDLRGLQVDRNGRAEAVKDYFKNDPITQASRL